MVSFDLLSDFFELFLFLFGLFLLVLDLMFSLLISFLKFGELLEVGLLFAIVGENLFLLILKLLGGFHLFFHEFFGLKREFGESLFHVSFFVLVLGFDLTLLLLDFEEFGVFGLGLEADWD